MADLPQNLVCERGNIKDGLIQRQVIRASSRGPWVSPKTRGCLRSVVTTRPIDPLVVTTLGLYVPKNCCTRRLANLIILSS